MSSTELKELRQCMDHLGYILDKLGVTQASFAHGKVQFKHNGSPINNELMNNLCQHISNLRRDELATGEEGLPEYYFD